MRSTDLVSAALWAEVAPLLPPNPLRAQGGRPRRSDRLALCGILFVLFTATAWAKLPEELGCGSGVTCWRRLRDWQAAGVWEQLFQTLLARLGDLQALDWSQLAVDSQSLRAKKGGLFVGPSPVDRRKLGSKRHLIVEGHGLPLGVMISAVNLNDCLVLPGLVAALPQTPGVVAADKAYDTVACRQAIVNRGGVPQIPHKGQPGAPPLGSFRWIIERTNAWFLPYRHLEIRRERRADLHMAFTFLACALLCWRTLQRL